MMQASLEQSVVLKKVVDVLKEVVQECNIDCNPDCMNIQAMDPSHVALVALTMNKKGFTEYRCDKNVTLGVNVASLQKILRCSNNDDVAKLTYEADADSLSLQFENKGKQYVSEFNLKLMEIDSESLTVADQDHEANVTMSSHEFQRICRDLGTLNDSITLSVTKDAITFTASGDVGTGSIKVKASAPVTVDAEEVSSTATTNEVKSEKVVKDEPQDDTQMSDAETSAVKMESDDTKDLKVKSKEPKEKKEMRTQIEMTEPVSLNFALRYLNTFAKAASLSEQVKLSLSKEFPLRVSYGMGDLGGIKFFLAPKIDDEQEE